MSKRASLTYQVTQILSNSFRDGFGRSRHADKRNALENNMNIDAYTKDKIYSQNTYNSTRKTCVAFANFCKENYGVRYLEEIKSDMFSKFIERGNINEKKYEANTAATYYSQVKKLESAFNKEKNTKTEFADNSYKEYITENIQIKLRMLEEIHNKIIEKAYESKETNGLAFHSALSLALRGCEITNLRKEDFKFKNGKLESVHIHRSKGGRNRDVLSKDLTEEQIKIVLRVYDYFKDKLQDHDRLFINKTASYETAFKRIRDIITQDKSYNGCGIHSLRKEFVQKYFNREIEKRTSKRAQEIEKEPLRQADIKREIELEVKKDLTRILGHNRLEVLANYLD